MTKPNYSGTFHMVSQDNMDGYLGALDINYALRKIVCLLRPTKEITHDVASGSMKIRTLTTFKNFHMDFTLGQEFTEDLGPVDGRKCQTGVCAGRVVCDKPVEVFLWYGDCGGRARDRENNNETQGSITLKTTVDWDGDKLLCVQRGEKEGRGWTHWLEGNTLHLEMRVGDAVAKQVFKKAE